VIGERLIFHGLAWPTAKAVPVSKADPLRVSDNDRPTGTADRFGVASAASEPAGTDLTQFAKALQDFPTFGSVSRQNSHSRSLMLTAPSGHGRPWQADAPEAFWRDFAALNLSSDADGMVAFVRRRGDPEGLLNRPGASADSGRWRTPLHNGLRYFAACWTEADEQGVSHCNRDPHDAVEWWQLRLFPAISPQIELIPAEGGTGLALYARALGAFMALSAASALERKIQMRRCRHCDSWFELRRKDMLFCSATCRAALFNSAKQKGER